ncbi:hypothetical protein CYLTODRAFT_422016 [Cylindrobasidium torrendii FP15055 ss-10]|uniref:Uncharacterized protein n=1 Tax=Cylindrobasidium torrendii FP15055 ss-10 TaxID=1314674 RepID=A0A0D7BBT5_9AGAR|nr:hypothetical protein CYLTODRAFT_422016 [Cylindrobasidium torrendii FP15055 ss-10]
MDASNSSINFSFNSERDLLSPPPPQKTHSPPRTNVRKTTMARAGSDTELESDMAACPFCAFCTTHSTFEVMECESATERLLKCNEPPLQIERPSVRADLSTTNAQIITLSQYIQQSEAAVARMKQARTQLEAHRSRLLAVFHPMRGLPDDIIMRIFETCTPWAWQDKTADLPDSVDISQPPWSLASVSRHWRALALARPRLWSSIRVVLDAAPSGISPETMRHRLETFVQRSKNVDLKVYLIGMTDTCELMPILRGTTGRWRILRAELPKVMLDTFLGCPFRALNRLIIDFKANDASGPMVVFRETPMLRHACLTHGDGLEVDLPWEQLESFDIHHAFWMLKHLHKMTSLQKLLIKVLTGLAVQHRIFKDAPEAATLPALRRFSIGEREHGGQPDTLFSYVFKTFHTPELRVLDWATKDTVIPRLPTFQHDPTTLTKLAIVLASATLNASDLLTFFASAPNVDALYLRVRQLDSTRNDFETDVFRGLKVVDGSVPILPRLTSLRVNGSVVLKYPHSILELVATRLDAQRGAAVLEEVQIVKGAMDAPNWKKVRQRYEHNPGGPLSQVSPTLTVRLVKQNVFG